MIRFEQVHKRYASGREALAGVSFAIEDGEMAFLTGHSGAGKITGRDTRDAGLCPLGVRVVHGVSRE